MDLPSYTAMKNQFLGKKILVTGHTGFNGSWMVKTLCFFGAEVHGFSLSRPVDSRHAFYELQIEDLINNPQTCFGDVRSKEFQNVLETNSYDYIFHLAAQAIVSESLLNPFDTFSTNILGVLNLLEAYRTQIFSATCIIITSDKCYANDNSGKIFTENDILGGIDPYSASKASAEIIIHSYLETFPEIGSEKGIASVRAGNVFGGGDWSANRLIPDCARAFSNGGEIKIRMPNATRPWTSVHDVIYGYLLLAINLQGRPQQFRGSWNFASGENLSVLEVAQIFRDHFGKGEIVCDESESIGKESKFLQIDPEKARKNLGWSSKKGLTYSLVDTAEWYLQQLRKTNMNTFSSQFLKDYYT